MTPQRFHEITHRYGRLELAVIGDFCLDRYLEIDPARQEISIETGLAVHNVVNVRSQLGGAGTVLNNLVALGAGTVHAIGCAGNEGEGLELRRALTAQRGVQTEAFVHTPERRTFTYCKPMVIEPGRPPRELERLDFKNWSPLPAEIDTRLVEAVRGIARRVNAMIVLSQTDHPATSVVTAQMLAAIKEISEIEPRLLILADSRSGLAPFPPVDFKMNAAELARWVGAKSELSLDAVKEAAGALAKKNRRHVFVTLGSEGIVGASPKGQLHHAPTLPVRGPIDIVGAGDAVMANLACALIFGATVSEALEIANAAASIVVHQLGTTGTATVDQIAELLFGGTAA